MKITKTELRRAEAAERVAVRAMTKYSKLRNRARIVLHKAIQVHVDAEIELDLRCRTVDGARDEVKRLKDLSRLKDAPSPKAF